MGAVVPIAMLAFSAASTAVGVVRDVKQASDTKRQYVEAQRQAQQNADYALSYGHSEAAKVLGQGSRNTGAQVNDTAARGFDVRTGTARQIVDATNLIASEDAFTVRENARRQALGYSAAAQSDAQAADRVSPWGAITGTLLGGASQIGSQWESRRINSQAARI